MQQGQTLNKAVQGFMEAITRGVKVRASAVVVPERSVPDPRYPRWFATYRCEDS